MTKIFKKSKRMLYLLNIWCIFVIICTKSHLNANICKHCKLYWFSSCTDAVINQCKYCLRRLSPLPSSLNKSNGSWMRCFDTNSGSSFVVFTPQGSRLNSVCVVGAADGSRTRVECCLLCVSGCSSAVCQRSHHPSSQGVGQHCQVATSLELCVQLVYTTV